MICLLVKLSSRGEKEFCIFYGGYSFIFRPFAVLPDSDSCCTACRSEYSLSASLSRAKEDKVLRSSSTGDRSPVVLICVDRHRTHRLVACGGGTSISTVTFQSGTTLDTII